MKSNHATPSSSHSRRPSQTRFILACLSAVSSVRLLFDGSMLSNRFLSPTTTTDMLPTNKTTETLPPPYHKPQEDIQNLTKEEEINDTLFPLQHHRPTYFELREEIQNLTTGKHFRNFETAFSKASVVDQGTPWFSKKRHCKETCCVETVAVSMDQDNRKPIHWTRGIEIADLIANEKVLHGYGSKRFDVDILTEDMVPCLVPGTIIFLDNIRWVRNHFLQILRPKIRVPYVLVLAMSDDDIPKHYPAPRGDWAQFLADPLILQLYGTNPNHPKNTVLVRNKPQGIGLGLSAFHRQEPYIEPYLDLTNYSNPFLDKTRFQRPLSLDSFHDDVFVHFGLTSHRTRKKVWSVLCVNTTVTDTSNGNIISCGANTKNVPPIEIYSQMSKYRFGISPRGQGWDCHRSYELLLMGVIPVIEERDPEGFELFEGLPVVHMPNMTSATSKQDFVDAIQKYISSDAFQTASFEEGWKKLFLSHTRRQILGGAGRLKDILVDEAGKEYYQAYRYSTKAPKMPAATEEEQIQSNWLEEPPQLSKKEKGWLEAWKDGGTVLMAD